LRFIFALADYLKVQAKNAETGLFDIAQSIYESWKARKEQDGIKSLLKHIEREVLHNERQISEQFKIWRMQTEIARLRAIIDEYRIVLEQEVNLQDGENYPEGAFSNDILSADESEVDWLTPVRG